MPRLSASLSGSGSVVLRPPRQRKRQSTPLRLLHDRSSPRHIRQKRTSLAFRHNDCSISSSGQLRRRSLRRLSTFSRGAESEAAMFASVYLADVVFDYQALSGSLGQLMDAAADVASIMLTLFVV